MSPLNENDRHGRRFWRSLDELAGSDEFRRFAEREFPSWADEAFRAPSRRGFLKLMGASVALAGMTGCRWPRQEIVPYAHRPDGRVPGKPLRFATAMDLHGAATGLLVTSYDGRPIKVEGNPDHPQSLGSTLTWHQAAVLDLYDPERSDHPVRDGEPARWEEFWAFARRHFDERRGRNGAGVAVLCGSSSSPSLADLRARFARAFPGARWWEYEPASRDNARDGAALAFGAPYRTHLHLDRARTIVSFDEDFLLHHPAAVRHARDFVAGRDPHGPSFNRLYQIESCPSVTGSVADHRIAIRAELIPVLALALAAELFLELRVEPPETSPAFRRAIDRVQVHPLYTGRGIDFRFARELVRDRGASLVVAGPRQPAEVHALVHAMNAALGNVGRTVSYTRDPDPERAHHEVAVRELAAEIEAGRVDTLLVLGGNPAWDAPADLGFGALLGRVPTTIHLATSRNETSRACGWHLPRAHFLETWGDARGWDGTVSVAQPLIAPLYDGKSDLELLAFVLAEPPFDGHDIVRRTFAATAGSTSEDDWRRALHDGIVAGTAWPAEQPRVRLESWAERLKPIPTRPLELAEGSWELVLQPSHSLLDGRFANNGWLIELPDPLTKLTWDNAALMAPATAERIGVRQGQRVRITRGDASVDLPVFVLPGQADGSIAVALGWGRTAAGAVGNGAGVDAYPLRFGAEPDRAVVQVERIPGETVLATTQNHFAMLEPLGAAELLERSVELAREIDLAELHGEHGAEHEAGGHGGEGGHAVQLWQSPEFEGHRWAMAIDLNACTGCSACIVACQAENNIPVVGKDEVSRGREMHWLRVDRYFSGDPAAPAVSHQPVPCMHCETAPCEQVCPVAATVHDREGLNVMVYNRCVGTRYCSNNCPYKVRRFNYFNNHKHPSAVEAMVYNPEVTLRSRGVMEKCTYCVQRIAAVKIEAKNERRPIRDGEITPACAQACPTRAIVFGDLADPDSRVGSLHRDPRGYAMLERENTRPRTRYLTRIRNRGVPGEEGAA